jgi:hypothetical protein
LYVVEAVNRNCLGGTSDLEDAQKSADEALDASRLDRSSADKSLSNRPRHLSRGAPAGQRLPAAPTVPLPLSNGLNMLEKTESLKCAHRPIGESTLWTRIGG